MKKIRSSVTAFLAWVRPAWDELGVYPCALAGVICSPILAAATAQEVPKIGIHVADFFISLVLTAIVLIVSELHGSAADKKIPRVRTRRYAMAFLGGIAWRQVVPAAAGVMTGLANGISQLWQP